MAHILFLEPFYTGSHRYFADGLKKYSSHSIEILSLPGRFWKWRMESAGLEFSRIIKEKLASGEKMDKPDLILAGNLMDLAQFKAFSPWPELPHILYVHENQLDYPLSPGEKRDFHYPWKDYTNFLISDGLIFNSAYNLESFLEKFKSFSSRLPDTKPGDPSALFRSKSVIIPPGCRLISSSNPDPDSSYPDSFDSKASISKKSGSPVILWNQRWEHDKNPQEFFSFLRELKKKGKSFQLIVGGESFRDSPVCFQQAQNEFKDEIIHMGYAESRREYESLLLRADIVVSTAVQENFGISVMEALSAGCLPLLPRRLAYPEVLNRNLHGLCLYRSRQDMFEKYLGLEGILNKGERTEKMKKEAVKCAAAYSWEQLIPRFDKHLEKSGQKE